MGRAVAKESQSVGECASGLGLFTDLYELTMLQAYLEEGMTGEAVFTLFARRLPRERNYLLACGIDTVLDYLEQLRLSREDLDYLESLGMFGEPVLKWLRNFRFTGEVRAVADGTPVFANEPIMEVVAPLPQAQLLETLIINQVHLQTVLASKAARVVTAARGRPVIDFGARRMHGTDAAVKAARAFYLAGCTATSNVLAGKLYGLPVAGTMAHSYVQAHEDEFEAFEAFARLYPTTVLLVDTYDTLEGVRRVVELSRKLGGDFRVRAIRLDSGDLAGLAREARRLLDDAGLAEVQIFASGSLDEYSVDGLLASGAPIDGFGVGTKMGVSSDAPDLDMAFKLAEYAGKGRLKLSPGKSILPGRKQVFRRGSDDEDRYDLIGRAGEAVPGRPLLEPVMRGGKRMEPARSLQGARSLQALRDSAARQKNRLPPDIRANHAALPPYPVEVSPALAHFTKEVEAQIKLRSFFAENRFGDTS